jgi:transposase
MDMVDEIISRVARRRRWTCEQKLKILAEALEPGAVVSAVADRNGISRSQVYAWKRLAQTGGIPGISLNGPPKPLFAPVGMEALPAPPTSPLTAAAAAQPQRRPGVVEIVLTEGRIVRVDEGIEPVRLARLVAVLDGTRS